MCDEVVKGQARLGGIERRAGAGREVTYKKRKKNKEQTRFFGTKLAIVVLSALSRSEGDPSKGERTR